MSQSARAFSPGRLSSGALYALVILAPLLGGSSSLETLAGLAIGWLVAAGLLLASTRRGGRRISWPSFAVGLIALALVSALQAVSLPVQWLAWASPRAYEIRAFVLPSATHGALTYEVGASWRETAKLLLYAGVFVVASHRARSKQGLQNMARSVVVAGLAVFVTGLVHRILGTDRIFGLVDTLVPMSQSLTTFSNPNHAAGFLTLAAFCGLGLALEARSRTSQWVFGVGTAVCLLGSVAAFSRAGLLATAVSGAALFFILARRGHHQGETIPGRVWLGGAALAGGCVAAVLLLRAPEMERELAGAEQGQVLGLTEKLAAMRDAIPMTLEHAWTGIGRGAYASVYTVYKSSSYQLTFAFPENIAAQLLSEWGLLFGSLALLALLYGLSLRLLRADSKLSLAILVGIAGLVFHNLLDFSLELPGIAVPAVALLGAVSARVMPAPRLGVQSWWGQVASVGALGALLAYAVGLSFSSGELFRDLRAVSALVSSAEGRGVRTAPRPELYELEQLVVRHPANALLTVQLAYAAEQANPPDLRRALSLSNRAMYLAPTYAEGYFIAGRALIRLGHRDQGLGLLRTAWSLSARPSVVVEQVVWFSKNAAEVRRAIPRTDELTDRLSIPALKRAVHVLRARGRRADASAVLGSVDHIKTYPNEDLLILAQLALEERSSVMAEQFLAPLVEGEAVEPRALVLKARILELEKRHDELERLLGRMAKVEGLDEVEILRIRLRRAISARDFEAARAALEDLKRQMPPTYATRAELAHEEARLELAAGRSGVALSVLSRALELVPEDHRLRYLRAQLLEAEGRQPEAVRDLELVLRAKPRHTSARRALDRLRGAASERAPP